jgi:uncharacterized Tic20 family protein
MAFEELKEDYQGERVRSREAPLAETPSAGSLTAEDKQWGMFCHLSALLGLVIGGLFIVGPLVCWLAKKDSSKFVDYHGKESVNFQLCILIVTFICAITIIGIPIAIVLAFVAIIMPIIAGMKANEGEYYQYPYIFRLIK